jgi:sialidase-1
LVWNRVASNKGTPRTPLTAAISQDEGKSWGHVQHIEPAPDWDSAYASVYFQDDEALIAYYSRSHKWSRDTEVMLKAIPVEQFYL